MQKVITFRRNLSIATKQGIPLLPRVDGLTQPCRILLTQNWGIHSMTSAMTCALEAMVYYAYYWFLFGNENKARKMVRHRSVISRRWAQDISAPSRAFYSYVEFNGYWVSIFTYVRYLLHSAPRSKPCTSRWFYLRRGDKWRIFTCISIAPFLRVTVPLLCTRTISNGPMFGGSYLFALLFLIITSSPIW